MSTARKIASWLGVSVALILTAVIVGLLSEAHLEVSFDKLRDFHVTSPSSYTALLTSVKVDVERNEPERFRAYFGENDNGRTSVSRGDVTFKKFLFSSRIRGTFLDKSTKAIFSIAGYYNDRRLVFAHRGPESGVGIYMLERFEPTGITKSLYAGYTIHEDVKFASKNELWITRCPFVMIEESLAAEKYDNPSAAKAAFPLLASNCVEFKLPTDLR